MATDQPAADIEERPARRRLRVGRVGKWLLGIAAAFVLLIVGALVVLNTPLGERFIASRIAERTFPNGLNIRIGRIEGNLYGAAVLHDVRLSDPKGVFLTIPRAEIDWNPGGWLSNRLEIDTNLSKLLRVLFDELLNWLVAERKYVNRRWRGFDRSGDRTPELLRADGRRCLLGGLRRCSIPCPG